MKLEKRFKDICNPARQGILPCSVVFGVKVIFHCLAAYACQVIPLEVIQRPV